MEKLNNTNTYDMLGIIFSALCSAHCIITPILLLSAPLLGEALHSTWAHTGLITLMLFAFYQSIYKNFKFHQSKFILGLGLLGVCFVIFSYGNDLFVHSSAHGHHDDHSGESLSVNTSIIGALFLVASHILNIKKNSLQSK